MAFTTPILDPKYVLDAFYINYGPPSVLVFFVLSGYVIGLTVGGEATIGSVGQYLRRRALRIVPIAWLVILISVVLRPASGNAMVGNLLFLQNVLPYPLGVRFPLLSNNPPLWSLSYEILYYLCFIAIWRFSPRVWTVYAVTLLLALGRPLGVPPIIASQAVGMLFWLSGLSIAWLTKGASSTRNTPWLAAIVGSYAFWTIGPFKTLTLLFLRHYATPSMLSLGRMDFCLGATLIVLAVSNRAPQVQRKLALAALLLVAAILPLKSFEAMLTASDVWAMLFIGLAVILWRWRPSAVPLLWLAPVGAFSYALYAVYFPIALAIRDNFTFLPSGSAGSYIARLAIFLVIAFPLAWFLERYVQSWVRTAFGPRFKPGKGPKGQRERQGAVLLPAVISKLADPEPVWQSMGHDG
jgi:peptidoglycan/LPS O-acetylase OafA/YrhL